MIKEEEVPPTFLYKYIQRFLTRYKVEEGWNVYGTHIYTIFNITRDVVQSRIC